MQGKTIVYDAITVQRESHHEGGRVEFLRSREQRHQRRSLARPAFDEPGR